MANKKKKMQGFPHDATPDVHPFPGNTDSCFDQVNQYGTYQVQRTNDTENVFPLIAQALPDGWKDLWMDKWDVLDEE